MAKRQEQFLRDIKKRAKKGAKFNPTGQHPGLKNIKKLVTPTDLKWVRLTAHINYLIKES